MILFHGFTSFSMCRSPIEDNNYFEYYCMFARHFIIHREMGVGDEKVSLGTYKRVLDKSEAAVCRSHLPLQK